MRIKLLYQQLPQLQDLNIWCVIPGLSFWIRNYMQQRNQVNPLKGFKPFAFEIIHVTCFWRIESGKCSRCLLYPETLCSFFLQLSSLKSRSWMICMGLAEMTWRLFSMVFQTARFSVTIKENIKVQSLKFRSVFFFRFRDPERVEFGLQIRFRNLFNQLVICTCLQRLPGYASFVFKDLWNAICFHSWNFKRN